jgi:hypothetical protein
MSTNRHVPIIYGVISIAAALFVILYFTGWWKFIAAAFLLMFGWPSLKTGLFASDKEVRELTGSAPMSEDTARKFEDRI